MTRLPDQAARDRSGRWPVYVSRHARERARQRWPELKLARIVDEVRAALNGGRLSTRKPPGISGQPASGSLYVWTEDGQRVYALRAEAGRFVVWTTMRVEAEQR
jgi:hypothetical protein